MNSPKYVGCFLLTVAFGCCLASKATAINIVLDYSLDTNNNNWFGGSPEGLARRAALDSAAGLLSAIITNDDWSSLPTLNESFSLTDIAASSINDVNGNTIFGSPESDGLGFSYTINTTNRSSVAANEYIIYVAALDFDPGTSAHAKSLWDSSDRRNAAGFALAEFNTWGGKIYFDSGENWYAGSNPGLNPSDNYGVQDPDKSPATDISTDNWEWSTSSLSWKGFDLTTIDPSAAGRLDLYATGFHEMIHALGASTSQLPIYVGVDGNDDLIGANVTAEFGGPVPRSGGHFAVDTQSLVWNSDDIISEVNLDPNAKRPLRKYFTKLDAALLRDLGYDVLTSLSPGDFNVDALVDGTDLALWESAFGIDDFADANGDFVSTGADFLVWQQKFGNGAGALAASTVVPEPTSIMLCMASVMFVICIRHRS